jgi:hypothetical protein
MNLEEQDLIFGRLTRQRNESRHRLAALQVKVSETAKRLVLAGQTLRTLTSHTLTVPASPARDDAFTFPTVEEVLTLVGDYTAERGQLASLERQLSMFA